MADIEPPVLTAPLAQEMCFARGAEPPWAEALVFEGGGTKGIHYAGAISALDDSGSILGIRHFGGTSAGAQTAALLAFGYTGKELEQLMLETPWSTLLDGARPPCGWGCCCGYGCCKGCCRLYCSHGFYVGDVLESFLDSKFAQKRSNGRLGCTFQELYDEKGVELRVGACNVTKKHFEYFDRVTSPGLSVCKAVRASSAIPLLFLPQTIEGAVYVDGMFQGNLPIAAFPDKRTLAFHLTSSEVEAEAFLTQQQRKSLRDFIGDIFDMVMSSAQRKHGLAYLSFQPSESEESLRPKLDILTIDCGKALAMDPGVSQAQIRSMTEAGRKAAHDYLVDPARKRRILPSLTRSLEK